MKLIRVLIVFCVLNTVQAGCPFQQDSFYQMSEVSRNLIQGHIRKGSLSKPLSISNSTPLLQCIHKLNKTVSIHAIKECLEKLNDYSEIDLSGELILANYTLRFSEEASAKILQQLRTDLEQWLKTLTTNLN